MSIKIIIILFLVILTCIFAWLEEQEPHTGIIFPSEYGILAFLFGFATVIVSICFIILHFVK